MKTAPGSIGSLITAYTASRDFRNLRQNTRFLYARGLSPLRAIECLPVSDLQAKTIRAIRDTMSDTPAMANQFLSATSAMISWAIASEDDQWGFEHNPVRAVKQFKGGVWRRWPEEIIHAFDAANISRDVRLGFSLALHTGQRRGDILKMRWKDVDFDMFGGMGGVCVIQQKTARHDEDKLFIPLNPNLRSLLLQETGHTLSPFIVHDARGNPYWEPQGSLGLEMREMSDRQTIFSKRLKKELEWAVGKEASKGLSMHGLRRSAASRLAEDGCSIQEIMAITGHRSVSMVMHYTQEAEQKKNAEAAIRRRFERDNVVPLKRTG